MTQFFVQLPAGETMTLDLDLHTNTVAAVKAIVDARLESAWRASGVRILRSDLPFCGIRLRDQNRILAMDEVLSDCEIGGGMTLYAEWPTESEKNARRKRYGEGRDGKAVLETRVRGKRETQHPKKKTPREAAQKQSLKPVETSTQSAPETGGHAYGVSDDLGDNTELEAGDRADSGRDDTRGESEQLANEAQTDQRADEEVQEDGPAEEDEQDDPFADEDDNKENEEPPAWVPIEDSSDGESPAEEWLIFDERNTGLGLDVMEEMFDY